MPSAPQDVDRGANGVSRLQSDSLRPSNGMHGPSNGVRRLQSDGQLGLPTNGVQRMQSDGLRPSNGFPMPSGMGGGPLFHPFGMLGQLGPPGAPPAGFDAPGFMPGW